jgi:hypothetical protein
VNLPRVCHTPLQAGLQVHLRGGGGRGTGVGWVGGGGEWVGWWGRGVGGLVGEGWGVVWVGRGGVGGRGCRGVGNWGGEWGGWVGGRVRMGTIRCAGEWQNMPLTDGYGLLTKAGVPRLSQAISHTGGCCTLLNSCRRQKEGACCTVHTMASAFLLTLPPSSLFQICPPSSNPPPPSLPHRAVVRGMFPQDGQHHRGRQHGLHVDKTLQPRLCICCQHPGGMGGNEGRVLGLHGYQVPVGVCKRGTRAGWVWVGGGRDVKGVLVCG